MNKEFVAEDMLFVLDLDIESDLGRFFMAYFNTENEIKALRECEFKFTQLQEWKNDSTTNYKAHKLTIDDYKLSEIESSALEEARSGSFKHAEFVLKNRDDKYKAKKTSNEGVTIEDIIQEIADEN